MTSVAWPRRKFASVHFPFLSLLYHTENINKFWLNRNPSFPKNVCRRENKGNNLGIKGRLAWRQGWSIRWDGQVKDMPLQVPHSFGDGRLLQQPHVWERMVEPVHVAATWWGRVTGQVRTGIWTRVHGVKGGDQSPVPPSGVNKRTKMPRNQIQGSLYWVSKNRQANRSLCGKKSKT